MSLNITKKFITPNKYSRPQTKLNKVKGIVVHWWAVPNGSVNGVVNFYENRKNGKSGYGSAHFIVGIKGETVQCLPENELAYAVGAKKYYTNRLGSYPNNCTLHIEMAHTDMKGSMTKETWNTSVELTAHLLKKYGLGINDIFTHNQITGKNCPQLFVSNPREFDRFKQDVAKAMGKHITVSSPSQSNKTYLEFGDKGDLVKTLQLNLSKLGYKFKTIDGDFGQETKMNVLAFQKDNGLIVDGLFGQSSQAKLNQLLAQLNQPKQEVKTKEEKLSEVMKMKMSEFVNVHNMKQLEEVYKQARENGLLTDDRWELAAKNNILTVGDVAFLATILDNRRHDKCCKCCK